MPRINISVVVNIDSRIKASQIESIISNIVSTATGADPNVVIREQDSPGTSNPININQVLRNARPI